MKSMVPCQSISPFNSFHQTYTPWSSFHCAFHGNSKLPARPLFFLPWVGHGCLVLLGMYHHGADLFSRDSWSSSPDRLYTHPLSTPLFSCPCCDALPYLRPSNLWRPPTSFVSWLTTLPPSSQGTLGPLHRVILPSHYQAQQPTHLPPVPWPFPLPPVRSA